jgi:hypothetical protein
MPTFVISYHYTATTEHCAELFDLDPFHIAGCIGERVIQEWNPIFGPWS